jgi:hypothetical protein
MVFQELFQLAVRIDDHGKRTEGRMYEFVTQIYSQVWTEMFIRLFK